MKGRCNMKASYLDILNQAEKSSTTSLMWGRHNNGSIWISTCGYIHQEHMDLEKALLKAGCRYDFDHGISEFDRTNGRTTTWFKTLGARK